MSRGKIDRSLRKKQGERLTNELIAKYGLFRNGAKYKPFVRDLESYELISEQTICHICKGDDPIDSHVVAFGKVLGVLPDYLLCRCDYRTEDERKQAIISEYEAQKNKLFNDTIQSATEQLNKRIAIIRRSINLLEDRGYTLRYNLDAPNYFYLTKVSDGYAVKNHDSALDPECTIPPEDIYRQFCSSSISMVGISIFDNLSVHIISIDIISPTYESITLSSDSFVRMLYDIDDEISHRIGSWMRYHDYHISDCDDSDNFAFWDNTESET